MELRRFKDIMAMKTAEGSLLAFHARNLEVAQISEELWDHMAATAPNLAELVDWNNEEVATVKNSKINFAIRYLTLNITQICNLHCNYCAAGGDGSFGDAVSKISVEKTLPQLRFFLERLPEGVSFNISFLGGEPMLYPEALEMIGQYVAEKAPGRPANYTVITNGTLMTDKNVDILAKLKANITISLDGPAQINDVTRPTKNGTSSTALVMRGLEKVLARKKELGRVVLHAVFDNQNTEVAAAYEFFRGFAVDSFDFTFSVTETNPRVTQKFLQEMTVIAEQAYAFGGESALRKIRTFDQYFQALDQQKRTENFCGAGKSFLMIDARNQVFTCPWDVNDKAEMVGQGTELNEKALEPYQKNLIEANGCQNCWARFLCGGGCMYAHKHASGSKNIKNTQFCERTRHLVALTLLYYEKCRSAAS